MVDKYFKKRNLERNFIKASGLMRGFTLVELMVSLSVFSIVVVMSISSIVSVMEANRKAQSIRAVMDNLSSSIESMTRTIRFGTDYNCGGYLGSVTTNDCPSTSQSIMSVSFGTTPKDQVTFYLEDNAIKKKVVPGVGGSTIISDITSEDVVIEDLDFYVVGSAPYEISGTSKEIIQPKVLIIVRGYSGSLRTKSSFILQTTMSQRNIDYK